jgi:hypothetical protein
MGCNFNFQKLNAKTKHEAVQQAQAVIEQAKYDYGHAGYSGSFAEAQGVEVRAWQAKDAADAEQWLDENAEKWEAALLIMDRDGNWYMGANCSS